MSDTLQIVLFITNILNLASRTCIGGEPGTNNCIGDQIQSQICNTEGGSPCCQLRDVFNISTCQQFVGFGWCFTFHEYMERNCHLACCEDDHGKK